MSLPLHGSNPRYLYDYYELEKPREIIDFSVNTNPLGMPQQLEEAWVSLIQHVADYPDPENKQLYKILSEKINVDTSCILLGNGAAELISLLGFYLREQPVLIIQPTFSEYERMCQVHDCEVTHLTIEPEQSMCLDRFTKAVKGNRAVFFCNPNNPTGKYIKKAELKQMAEICRLHDCLFIVDEAFYDFLIDYDASINLHKQYSNLIILRSLTKIYSIAGLRLGYLVAQPAFIEEIKTYLPHWHINAIANEAGQLCLHDDQFVNKTQKFIFKERERMSQDLDELAFKVIKSDVNYYLIRDKKTKDLEPLFIYLLKQGLVLRHTVNFPGLNGKWLRVAVKTKEENSVLLEALKRWRATN